MIENKALIKTAPAEMSFTLPTFSLYFVYLLYADFTLAISSNGLKGLVI